MLTGKLLNIIKFHLVYKYFIYCKLNVLIYLALFTVCDVYVYISAIIHVSYTIWKLMWTHTTYNIHYSHNSGEINTGEKPIQCYICTEISNINVNLKVQTISIALLTCTCDHTGGKTYQCKCNGKDHSDIGRQSWYFVMLLCQYNFSYYHLLASIGEYTCTTYINARNGIVTYAIYHYV